MHRVRDSTTLLFKTSQVYVCIVAVLFIVATSSQNSTCRQVSELKSCAWVDYNSWFPGLEGDPKTVDNNLGGVISQIDDDECRWAYTAYFCAQNFPKCNENQDGPLPVCRDICQDLLDKCPSKYHNGVTANICDALPETECTSEACSMRPGRSSMILIPVLVIFSILYSQRRIRLV